MQNTEINDLRAIAHRVMIDSGLEPDFPPAVQQQLASRLRSLRRFAPAGLVDAGIRKMLKLDTIAAVAKYQDPSQNSSNTKREK